MYPSSAKKATDLAGEGELVAGFLFEHLAEARLCEAVTVERSGVEKADACVPSAFDDADAFGFFDLLEQACEWSSAEAEFGHRQRGSTEGDTLAVVRLDRLGRSLPCATG